MGIDKEWRSSMSQEDFAHGFAQTKDLLQNWKTDKTSANARGVMDQMWLWSGEYPFSSSVHTNGVVSAGDIGWMDGEIWRAIPLEHGDGEWEAIKGTQIAGYTRWTFEFRKGEEISLQTSLWSCWTDQIRDFFFRSGRLVAQRSAREVHELRAVTRSGVKNYATITVSGPEDDGTGEFGEHSEIYYFVHPVNADGSVVDPPGFWSFSSDPNPNDVLGSSMIKTSSRSEPDAEYTKISKPFLALIEDLVSHGFLAVPVENDASNCKEASRASVPDPAAAPRERRARRIFARARLSFGKPLTS
ncbi:hypothetical protein SISSUDRAFT_190311 [Sistotremastrum suecicum HHB10207 ss-3]|uniref:Uncharacterized protein n=1 Tax=Sistotremastrum suecicum HHB10207 ss-3 TaxID=1314776 RepID=A0A166ADJ9_9AGAM|nr:hypothetical protein SISSUDRAFT_190311 [Sistotremastrum suecicum HHB10207 ss-3]